MALMSSSSARTCIRHCTLRYTWHRRFGPSLVRLGHVTPPTESQVNKLKSCIHRLLFFSVIITSNFEFSPHTVNTVLPNSFPLLFNTTISFCPFRTLKFENLTSYPLFHLPPSTLLSFPASIHLDGAFFYSG